MADVIAECKERTYDFSWLPATLGDFKLVIDTTADGLYYRFFHYENELGWRWEALYDEEVNDYTVHVVMPLFRLRILTLSVIHGKSLNQFLKIEL